MFQYLGDSPNMVDYMIWPWFERLEAIVPYSKGAFAIPYNEQYKNLVKIALIMLLF